MSEFRLKHSFDNRLKEATRILEKFPNRIPVIVEIAKSSQKEITLDKCKYLVPKDLTVSSFMTIIRKRINITPDKALFMFFNNQLAPGSELIGTIYNNNKDECLFLFCSIAMESTFGYYKLLCNY